MGCVRVRDAALPIAALTAYVRSSSLAIGSRLAQPIRTVDELTPKVSVVTAAYQSLETLPISAGSVRRQSGVDVEHIIVDGGSDDGTVEWLRSLDDGTIWVSEPDKGIADAMNKGARLASGEWLLFLQADDRLYSPCSLKTALDLWDGKSEIIASPIQFESGRILRPRVEKAYYRYFKQGVLHQGALISRRAFIRVGEYDTRFRVTMDFDWFLRARWRDMEIQVLDEPLSVMGEDGISSRREWNLLRERLEEEQRSRLLRAPNFLWTVVYKAYGLVYRSFRYVMSQLDSR